MDNGEPRVPEAVLDRVAMDVRRLRQRLSPNHYDVTPEEAAAWVAASVPAFVAAEMRLYEQEQRDALEAAGYLLRGTPVPVNGEAV